MVETQSVVTRVEQLQMWHTVLKQSIATSVPHNTFLFTKTMRWLNVDH